MKQLNTNGSQISDFQCNHTQDNSIQLSISVVNDHRSYEYQISGDTRAPLAYLLDEIPSRLDTAIQNCLNVKISEYDERFYLFLDVQKHDILQVTGRRIK